MSTGRPPGTGGGVDEHERVVEELSGRCWTGTITPVEVSLWAQAATSASWAAIGWGALPGSAVTRIE